MIYAAGLLLVLTVAQTFRARSAADALALERVWRVQAERELASARVETSVYRDKAERFERLSNETLAANAKLRAELVAKVPDSEIGGLAVKAFK